MQQEITPPIIHGWRLIPLASERLTSKPTEIKELTDGKDTYTVYDFYHFSINDPFPRSLFFLATGLEVDWDFVWKNYLKSDTLYFFICQIKNA